MKIQNTFLGIGVAVAVILGGYATHRASQPLIQSVVTQTEGNRTDVGALTGPDIPSPYLNVGGVRHEYRRMELATATTTPCALQSPAATSTLVFTSLQLTTATSTATTWTAATSTTAFATTTRIVPSISLASGLVADFSVATSSTLNEMPLVTPPNSFVVWGVAGTAVADVTKLNGSCSAEFIVL